MMRIAARTAVIVVVVAGIVAVAAVADGSPPSPGASGGAYAPAPSAPGAQSISGASSGRSASQAPPIVVYPDSFDISAPMRDVVVPLRPGPPVVEPVTEREGVASNRTASPDPVAQRTAPPTSMPAPINNFEGLGNPDNLALVGSRVWPPDVEGDVGPSDYVEYVNQVWSVYDKATGAPRAGFPKSAGAIWAGMSDATCANNWRGDPIVVYDQAADRWVLSEFAFTPVTPPSAPPPPYKLCIAVSTTGDPTGSYARYSYEFTKFPDYPKMGVWPDGYYVSFRLFAPVQCCLNATGAGAAAFDRAKMLAADPAPAMLFFDTNDVRTDGMLPSDWEGDIPPPAGAPNIFLNFDDSAVESTPTDRLRVWKFDANFDALPPSGTFTNTSELAPAAFDQDVCNFPNPFVQACIPQPGTGTRLDAVDFTLMHRLQYRRFTSGQQSLVTTHTVDESGTGHAGIRWYELRLAGSFNPSIFQQGTYAPDALHRWMGSAAMDGNGNIAIGYSASSDTVSPSVRYAGRLESDPAGQLGQGETELQAGGGSQTNTNRWGDYTALQVDPVDECTFWYVNEYYSSTTASNDWRTRFGSFKFPSCSQPAVLAGIGKSADAPTVAAGSQIGFTVTLNNFSGDSATGVGISDTLPAGNGINWSIDAGNTDPGWSISGAPPSESLVYSESTLPGSSSSKAHVVSSTSTASCGPYENTATFTSSNAGSSQATASTVVVPTGISFSENFDGVTPPALPAGWTATNASGPAPLWVTSNSGTPTPVADTAPNAAYIDDPATTSDKRLDSPTIAVESSTAQVSFRHNYNFEAGFDGGVLEISIGGGPFADIADAGGSFAAGGYTGTIVGPNAGPAWTGVSNQFVTTTVNLPASAAGQNIQLRWRMTSDSSVGRSGWRVDSIALTDSFECAPTAVKVAWVTARASTNGVLVRWKTTPAARLLGFDVFRQTAAGRKKLNRSLIRAARSTRTYSYLARQARGQRSGAYWIRAVGLDRSHAWYGPVRVRK